MTEPHATDGAARAGRVRFVIGFCVILLAIGFLIARGAKNAMVYYISTTELMSGTHGQSEDGLRVRGKVVPGSILHDELTLRFSMTDGGTAIPVVYRGVVPDTFNEEADVVVEGGMQSGHFEANFLMAKCPSKYEAELDGDAEKTT